MSRIYFRCVPFDKGQVTLALESGVDGVIVPRARVEQVAGLSRCPVWADEDVAVAALTAKADEEEPEQEEDDDELVFKDIEALKAHIFTLSDNHMEQVVTLVRGWMKNDETAKV